MKEIQLTRGFVTQVDDEDYEWLSQWKWMYNQGYAVRNGKLSDGTRNRTTIFMHREVLKTPEGMFSDHKDSKNPLNKLNNQKSNLRVCTQGENVKNIGKHIDNMSGYKGVKKKGNRWEAQISVNGKRIFDCSYSSAEDAGIAYNFLAREYFGEFASFNEIDNWEERRPEKVTASAPKKPDVIPIVAWDSRIFSWRIQISVDGIITNVGTCTQHKTAVWVGNLAVKNYVILGKMLNH